jgi:hypothetical protein
VYRSLARLTSGTHRDRRFKLVILYNSARDANCSYVRRDIDPHRCTGPDDGPVTNAFSVNDYCAGAEVNAIANLYTARNVAARIDVAIGAD